MQTEPLAIQEGALNAPAICSQQSPTKWQDKALMASLAISIGSVLG